MLPLVGQHLVEDLHKVGGRWERVVDGEEVGFGNAVSRLAEIEITENGRYTPESEDIGFSSVDVNIGGVEELEQLIDESGVLDSTDGTATEKVEQLIEKAQSGGSASIDENGVVTFGKNTSVDENGIVTL